VSDHDRHPSWTSALLEVITQPIVLVVWIDQRGQDRDARARGELSAARAETCRNLDHQNARLRAVLRSFDPDGRSEKITAAIKAFTPPTCKPPS
jgi:hypothetical protein